MKLLSKTTLSIATATLLASSASFADMDSSYVNQALQWAPADSFLVLGNTQPYTSGQGEIFVNRMGQVLERQYGAIEPMLDMMLAEMEKDSPAGMEKLFEVYKDIFSALSQLSADDYRAMMVNTDSAFYFDGLVPVMRMEQSSEKYVSAINDVLTKHLPAPEALTVEGKSLEQYTIPLEDAPFELVVIVEKQADGFAFSIMPKPMKDYYIKRNFITPVNDSIWSSGKLAQVRDEFGYNGLSEGYLDMKGLLAMLIENPADSNDPIISMMGGMMPDIKAEAPGCYEVANIALNNVPRIVMGVKESTQDADQFNMTIEMSDDITDQLKRIPNDIPGTQVARESLFSFGIGVDLMNLKSGLQSLADFVERNSKACPPLAEMDMQEMMMGMDMMMNPMVTQFSGANMIVTDFKMDPSTGEPDPESIKGVLSVAMDDTQAIMDMAPMMGIDIDVPANGSAVDFPAELLPPELVGQTVMVGRNSSEIAIGTGSNAKQLIEAVLADDEIRMDQALTYTLDMNAVMNNPGMKALMMKDLDGFPESEVNELKAMFDNLFSMYEVYEKLGLSIEMNDKGLGFTIDQSYNL